MIKLRKAAVLALVLAALIAPAAAAADALQNATVIMTDTGFSPAAVSIPVGGSITWKNQGSITHNAVTVGAPSAFSTAGIGSGESATLVLTVPGTYYYTSGTDCLYNNSTPGFPCTVSFVVTVGSPSAPSTSAAPAAAPAAVPAGPVATASVTVTDSGFSPASVSIGLNGTVTWANRGANVHTATSTPDSNTSLPPFDSGGLGPGQASSRTFPTPGTYVYFSAPDCFSKSNPGGFSCGYYTVLVGAAPVASASSQQPGPTPIPVFVPGASATVAIDDNAGFSPNTITVKTGQPVSWLNTGNNTHSVVINQNPTPDKPAPWWLPYQLPSVGGAFFDSGGLAPQQSYSYTFTTAGNYPYHSSTEAIYQQNQVNCSCTFVTYQFFGTVVVQP
ncbi:MAG TPA: hypothetical protein VK457_24070 [Chloroflexota bacterium]|nr:hypothetical protein [Chloroflexota bacterium]